MCLSITSCTIFISYMLQTKRNGRAVALSKDSTQRQLAKGRMTPSWHRLSTSILPSLQNTLPGGENTPARKPRWSKTFFQCCFKCCSRPPWNKMWISSGFTVGRTWPKVHCKCSALSPLAWKAYSKPSLLLLAMSICLWGGKFINHSLQWKISCLTQDGCNRIRGWHPPRRCKTGDRNVSLSQQGY